MDDDGAADGTQSNHSGIGYVAGSRPTLDCFQFAVGLIIRTVAYRPARPDLRAKPQGYQVKNTDTLFHLLRPLTLGKHGHLTQRQIIVLLRVGRATPNEGLSVREFAKEFRINKPAITRAIDALTHEGLVERRPHKTDGRLVQVRITPAGIKWLKAVDATKLPAPLAIAA